MANFEMRKVFNCIGFWATLISALALLISIIVSLILNGTDGLEVPGFAIYSLVSALTCFANVLAYFVAIVAGFYYAKSKRNLIYLSLQIIASIIICATIILSLF